MKNEPLVSIIMNCYNGEEYLRDAIDSVINQTYDNWELIFWDNVSTDKSAEIFKSYKDKRLKYYCASAHTKILYEAKSYALEKAMGEFIAFLDVDDWWYSQKLELQIPLFKDSNVGLVYGNLLRFFVKKNKKKIYRKNLPTGNITEELLNDYVIGSPTYIVRKKALESLKNLFNKNFHIIGDFDLNVRISIKWKIDCIQAPIAVARIHGKNQSLLNKDREIDELKIWYKKIKTDSFFSSSTKLKQINLKISYLEIIKSIAEGNYTNSIFKVLKYPLSFKKIKLLMALFLPRFIFKKIQNY